MTKITDHEPNHEIQPTGAAAGIAVLAFTMAGCLIGGIRIGLVIDPLVATVLTWMFFGPIAVVAVLMVLGSFLSKVK